MEEVVRRALREEKQEAQMEGYLKKLGTNTRMFSWCDRWCILRKGALCFWEERPLKDDPTPPKTAIPIKDVKEVSYCEKKPFAFKLVRVQDDHPVFLEAGSTVRKNNAIGF